MPNKNQVDESAMKSTRAPSDAMLASTSPSTSGITFRSKFDINLPSQKAEQLFSRFMEAVNHEGRDASSRRVSGS